MISKKAKFADPLKWVEDDVYYDFIEQIAAAHARRAVEEAAARRSGERVRRPRREGHSGNGGKKSKVTKKKE
ncbi:hypothetical protein N7467_002633 [Penicillium canescens]|nr:hypothetical protein N7467_002633 [Penicillium canescens]